MQRSIIAPAERVTNLRWSMLAVVAALVFAVSFDGLALVLGGWTNLDRLAFAIGAIVAQLPAGIALDRYGVRRTGTVAAIVWIAGALAAAFGGPAAVVAASVVTGAALSAFLPLAIKATASWFPRTERGLATAFVVAAANAPIVIALLPFAPKLDGGSAALAPIGLAALVTIVFALVYRDADDPRVTYAERTYIADGGAQPVAQPGAGALAQLARARSVWTFAFAFGSFGFAFGFGAVQIWGVAFAWLALFVTLLIGGAQVDVLARGGGAGSRARTLVLVIGTLCGCASIGILGPNPTLGIACTALALFGFAAAQPVAWSVPGFIAPRGAVGSLAAIAGLAATIGAVLAWLAGVDTLGAAIAALIGAALFAFSLDRIEPIADPV